tara:strand:+ start:590 stop:1021 length:432 start_codon:yes stop_codon:yes gene_type:complete
MLRTLKNIIATRYNRALRTEVSEGGDEVHTDIVVWVGFDREAVDCLVKEDGDTEEIVGDLMYRLGEMVSAGKIDITREYTVTMSVTVSGSVQHTTTALSADEAAEDALEYIGDLVIDLVDSGELNEFDDCDTDDVAIQGVEEA